MKLDRDWYTGAEEGGVAGDDEHNPLAQYEDLSALKEAEIATKQVVCCLFICSERELMTFSEKSFCKTSPICECITANYLKYVSTIT